MGQGMCVWDCVVSRCAGAVWSVGVGGAVRPSGVRVLCCCCCNPPGFAAAAHCGTLWGLFTAPLLGCVGVQDELTEQLEAAKGEIAGLKDKLAKVWACPPPQSMRSSFIPLLSRPVTMAPDTQRIPHAPS
jgi:hypothetical protein